MSDGPLAALAELASVLRKEQRAFALVGGLAVSIRGEVRATMDVDVAVAVDDDEEAEALVRALVTHGYTVKALVEHDLRRRLATIRLLLSLGPRRPQDRVDLASLLDVNPGVGVQAVRDNLDLITERGFDRGRPLAQRFEDLLRERSGE